MRLETAIGLAEAMRVPAPDEPATVKIPISLEFLDLRATINRQLD